MIGNNIETKSNRTWRATWIESPSKQSLPIFQKNFFINQEIKEANIYISGLGQFELTVNGDSVTDEVLLPAWSDYSKRIYYKRINIKESLMFNKRNIIEIMVGNGFYNVKSEGRYSKFERSYGAPKVIAELEITYVNGTRELIISDHTWKVVDSPITLSSVYGGEDYDSRIYKSNFGKCMNRSDVLISDMPLNLLTLQTAPELEIIEEIYPQKITKINKKRYLIDFGQNISGWPKISIEKGVSGEKIRMIPSELLTPTMEPNQKWTGSPMEWNYICNDDEKQEWAPRFSYYGFRYLLIEGACCLKDDLEIGGIFIHQVKAQMISPKIVNKGCFESSNTLINNIHHNICWSILGNMKSIFTDCPHREKLGWLEQDHLMGPAISYNFNVDDFYEKVLQDISDSQLENGMIPTIAPEYVVFSNKLSMFRDSVPWGGAFIIIPWQIYQRTGEISLFKKYFESMVKYIHFILGKTKNYIVQGGLGDWYDIGMKSPGFSQATPVALVETAIFFELIEIMEKISKLLDKKEEELKFTRLSRVVKDAFNDTFFDKENMHYGNNSQTSNAMPLVVGLCTLENEKNTFENLVNSLKKTQYHITAGDIGNRYVLLALLKNSRSDLVFNMTQHTDNPSYGYQIVHGATTLTEAWDGPTIGKSQNHFMLGHIEEWFYKGLAGINLNYNQNLRQTMVHIAPFIPESLEWVKAETYVKQGQKVSVSWKKTNENIQLKIIIPNGCQGTIEFTNLNVKNIIINNVELGEILENEILNNNKEYPLFERENIINCQIIS